MENQYEKMSLAELRSLAKEKGVTGITTKKKQELANLLNEMAESAKNQEGDCPPENAPAAEKIAKPLTKEIPAPAAKKISEIISSISGFICNLNS